jgi:hypothetical protein
MMSRATRLTYLLLAGSFMLICVSAYLLLSQASDLASARAELDETNRDLAQRQAQLLVLTDALIASEDQAKMVEQVSGKVQSICSRQKDTNAEVRALCALSQWATSYSGRFLAAYAAAAGQRASATSPADWQTVRGEYAGLRGFLTPEVDPGHQWAARVEEGTAYSDYRLGRLKEASAAADRAFQLDRRSAFVGLTRLKIACSKKAPKDAIAKLYSDQRRLLEESVRNPIPPMDKRYAGYELSYFDRDAEVRVVCAYAKLPTVRSS